MRDEPHHFRNIALLWLAANGIMLPLVVFVFGPGMPPGNATVESHGQVVDNTVLLATATPVALAVLVYFAYALWAFRERQPDLLVVVDGPAIKGNATVQFWWLIVTTTLVLFLAGYGSIRLLADGAGGGQGPNPLSVPAAAKNDPTLQVQVIAQQWEFTYRYPAYGGVETRQLELPAHTSVEFHVTSLDVIHSFWAYQLGVKVDANPGEDNTAFVTTIRPVDFNVRCAELCGLWHGYMFNGGKVVPKAEFAAWITQQRREYAPVTAYLPRYALKYFPAPQRRGG